MPRRTSRQLQRTARSAPKPDAPQFREVEGEGEAEQARDAFLCRMGREPSQVAQALGRVDGALRVGVVSRLQQEHGNAYVQRLVAEGHPRQRDTSEPPLAVQRDEVGTKPVAKTRAAPGTNGKGYVVYENEVRVGGSLAWRNNNPGNLRSSSDAIGKHGGFAIFPDEDTGRAALKTLLQSDMYNKLTIKAAIARYAPAWDKNDPKGYVKFIEKQTGLDSKRIMGDLAEGELEAVMGAIEKMEGWIPGTIYTCDSKATPKKYRDLLGC